MKQYYFISGLPRSGSTLLSAILNQNPKFSAGISTNLLPHVRQTIEAGNGARKEFDEKRLKRIIKATVDAYYEDNEKEVIFDTNRLWNNLLPQLRDCYPYTKIIVCVRDINKIIDSFERLHQLNPYRISTIFPANTDLDVYTRANSLFDVNGMVLTPYNALKSALTGINSDMLFFMEYEILCKNPKGMMQAIYNFIGQDYFEHDFNNVESSYDEYDEDVGIKDLHKTRKVVEYSERDYCIPPDIINQYKNYEVWRQ